VVGRWAVGGVRGWVGAACGGRGRARPGIRSGDVRGACGRGSPVGAVDTPPWHRGRMAVGTMGSGSGSAGAGTRAAGIRAAGTRAGGTRAAGTGAADLARRAVTSLRSALDAAPPAQVRGSDAARMAELFAHAERVAAAGKALYARQVAATGAYGVSGHPDAARWLAQVSGEPVGRAKEALSTAEAVGQVPEVHRAFVAGELSGSQARVIGEASALDPSATPTLLGAARDGSFGDVAAMAARAIRRARSEEDLEEEEARVHARRFCRVVSPREGGLRIEAWLTRRVGARVLSHLEQEVATIFAEVRGTPTHEPHERYRADALVRLVCGDPDRVGGVSGDPESGGPGPNGGGRDRSGLGRSGPGAHVVVRVDAGALRRGHLEAGEVCEIPGVGPVPVAVAHELLGDAFYSVVVTEGVDVRCVTSTKRTIPTALRVALFERDPVCVVPGCGVAHHLEIDHWQRDFAQDGPTCLENLARLCGPHHAMKTHTRWRLTGGPGRWGWVGPRATAGTPDTGGAGPP